MDKGILKNVGINFIGLILPTFISLVTVPSYIKALGVERYGVVALVWVLIGYFGFLDLGMSMAAQNQISKARASEDKEACTRVFWSATWLNLATGVAGGLVIYFGTFLYTSYFSGVSPALQHEVVHALPWLAMAIPIANVSWVFAGAISGAEKFGSYNTNQTIGTFLFQLLPLFAAWWIGPTLPNVLAAAVAARTIAALMLARSALKVLDIRTILPPRFGVAKGLFSFGGWMFVSSTMQLIGDSADRVLVGSALGARFVTYYSVPQNLVWRLGILPSAMMRTLFPRFSALKRESADLVMRQSLEFLNGVFTPIMLTAMLVLGPFLHLWVGPEVASAGTPVGRILIIFVWLTGQSNLARILIQAQAQPALAARVSLIETPLFAAVIWGAVHYFGLTGAAVAVVARGLFDYFVLLWLSRIHARQIVLDMSAHLAFLVATLWLSTIATTLPQVAVAVVLVVGANVAWSLTMTPALRELARAVLGRLARLYSGKGAS
ncbi:oligosaccharide flippase family protein [Paraburkholderia humisilvae]|uniref:Polysaccharide biosynthesis protein C-terminal domain-containing protein n=1 Tax=Paraburkholderia humisilvae TaxID=627669 RepID=A0A6J5DBN2_9BURK|nr:oligosaccharide flippase family protein [Paraburkholderia humisilvae]CAB3750797.1 hypothetical protein LMG29542_01338 [Paraburkholderia humisilvae]